MFCANPRSIMIVIVIQDPMGLRNPPVERVGILGSNSFKKVIPL